MKLLYIWIEEFRNIRQQEIVVDAQYKISIDVPDEDQFGFYDSYGNRIYGAGLKNFRKVYYRKFCFAQNGDYTGQRGNLSIQSITALVGENASGKSSILECVHYQADQFNHRNKEARYFLLVFLDTDRQAIVVRTRDIWLLGAEDKKRDIRKNEGCEEYVFPLSEVSGITSTQQKDTTELVSIYQNYREEGVYAYKTLGLPVVPINMAYKHFRNSFSGVFDFLCEFPRLGAESNHVVFYLKDEESRERAAYFERADLTPDEYKDYFLRKLSQLLFGALRDYLYHEKPTFMMDGSRVKRPEEETLCQEDIACAKILSFCTFDYPHDDSISSVKTLWGSTPEAEIAAAIAFFRTSTYIYLGKSLYDQYLNCVEQLFVSLYKIDPQYFTALYKLSLPIETTFQDIIKAFDSCIAIGDAMHRQWADSIIPDFEWFSAGQRQISLLFSGLFQQLKTEYGNEQTRDLILMLDEPETHMHPETGRHFIETLDRALTYFRSVGLLRSCQVILATHSPFLIQSLCTYSASIALTENDRGQIIINNFKDLRKLYLPGRTNYSFNLVMYHVFHVSTTELHDELYGYLQMVQQCYSEDDLDRWFETNSQIRKTKLWIAVKRGTKQPPKSVTLQRYIRNFIHHPENAENQEYTPAELRQSIQEMLALI